MHTILVLGSESDPHVHAVCEILTRREARFTIADFQQFPYQATLTLEIEPRPRCVIQGTSQSVIDTDNVSCVWYRRLFPPLLDPAVIDADAKRFAMNESRAFLRGLWAVINDRPWVNPYFDNEFAESKLKQLSVAQEVGLAIPPSLITNDAGRVRDFFEQHGPSKIIYKPLTSFATDGELKDGKLIPSKCVYTTIIPSETLEQFAHQVKLTPCLFQCYIEKQLELRITVVGNQFFAAAIYSQQSAKSSVDWRKYDFDNTPYVPFELSTEIRVKLRTFLDHFGLTYGAIDCILTPDDEIVFLEVNPGGQWLWVERLTGLPISEAIADRLIEVSAAS